MIKIILIILFGIGSIFAGSAKYSAPITVPPTQSEIRTSYYGYAINTGMISPSSTVKEKNIIKDYGELTSFCNNYYADDDKKLDKLTNKYDSDFFKSKSLAILFIPVGNSNSYVQFNSATKEDSNVKINYKIITSDKDGLTVMSYTLIIVEIPKDITGIK